MRHNLLTSCVVMMGCAGAAELGQAEDPAPGVLLTGPAPLAGENEQGIYILGSSPDALFDGVHHYRVQVQAVDLAHLGYSLSVTAVTSGANLVATLPGSPMHSRADLWFEGMTLNGVGGGQVKLEPGSVSDGTITKYHLTYQAAAGAPWVEYCGDPTMLAVPLRGWYDGRRIHHDDTTITFSCDNGVATKCTMWGYIAGNAGPGLDIDPGHHAWNRHQACSLMANANYCVNGEPRTREETPILIRDYDATPNPYPDLGHPDPLPGNPDTYYLEAGWRAGPNPGPVCLSKLRWAALPPDPCPSVLPDPRSGDNAGAKFCDDMTLDDIRRAGALLVNGSKVMDAPLHVWTNPTSKDVVTTMRGYYASGEQVAPFTGYSNHLGVDSMLLRNLPGTIDQTEMFELHLWEHVGAPDRVVALAAPGADYKDAGFEAYSFISASRVPGLRALKLCHNAVGYYTTIGTCAGAVPLGYAMLPP